MTKYHRLGGFSNSPNLFLSSGGCRVQDQGSGRFGTWKEPPSRLQMADSSSCPHVAEGRVQLSEVSFIRALIPYTRSPLLCPNPLLKASPPDTITLGIKLQNRNSEGQRHSAPCTGLLSRLSLSLEAGKNWPTGRNQLTCTFPTLYASAPVTQDEPSPGHSPQRLQLAPPFLSKASVTSCSCFFLGT